jgi:three-Cys-motif partner protein
VNASNPESIADVIGPWSEIKLDIIRKYVPAYSMVLAKQHGFYHIYIDAFAGLGFHKSKTDQTRVAGSPQIAVQTRPPFREYWFIDINHQKVASLKDLRTLTDVPVHVEEGDCNNLLLDILPTVRRDKYRRALCLLDPYGLHLDWRVMELAGKMGTVEVFINFPIMDINRNVLRKNADDIDPAQAARLDRFWGDNSWRKSAYSTQASLFGWEEKENNEQVVAAFCERLKQTAGFAYVAPPLAMRNSVNAVVYYLLFASPNKTGSKIVNDIFAQYR